jgi:hypothetical protein
MNAEVRQLRSLKAAGVYSRTDLDRNQKQSDKNQIYLTTKAKYLNVKRNGSFSLMIALLQFKTELF